ncbi:3-deoxy-D-manno-octulosonic acid transferase [Marinigracilibium pacificum]|uniref:3-deoxy-D-manno-octulosonic acid transferase n=1 Tax=Marinigracilibium pacificum TaxID=2729599 RepID=A0A848J673_9BACT|nr:glycosyltransferase N-terminal domain-containing protein [Marinigracilibium pacificum]NMM48632.1 3-deoxy-D-manno-octulosonic acid transferase [Marinigracilibium pacificum]
MNSTTYSLGINLYKLLIKAAAPFNDKASMMIEGRKDWQPNLKSKIPNDSRKKIWFHCASLGEFEQARPVIERINRDETFIIVTFFSPSGYEVRKNYDKADLITYLPFDTKSNAKSFIDIINPDLVLFTKYEFWHFFLSELNNRNIPTALFSAIFRPNQSFFKKSGEFFRNMLRCFSLIYVQNEDSRLLLSNIGINNVEIAGDTRFDRVIDTCNSVSEIDLIKKFKGNFKLLMVGSSWPEDIKALSLFFNHLPPDVKVVIAPHEISEKSITELTTQLPSKSIRFTKTDANSYIPDEERFLIIDNFGMLASAYQYGDIAFVGGAFKDGLHNILEAATFGMPVLFGDKNYKKFNEAILLIDENAAFPVGNSNETNEILQKLFADDQNRKSISSKSYKFVRENKGATETILKYIQKVLN